MTIQDEQELRRRLGALLNDIEPGPAPVTRTVRHGRGIRMRRWIAVAAGVAVIVAGAAVAPVLLRSQHPAPLAPKHYKVTVQHLDQTASRGVIGEGVTDGRHWRVMASIPENGPHNYTTIAVAGISNLTSDTSLAPTGSPAGIDYLEGGPGNGDVDVVYGTVARAVTSVSVRLPDGELLHLTPVDWHGYRWVGVVLPYSIHIVRVVAYSGSRELAYAIPYGDVEIVAWLRPGQIPPRRDTATIGAGVVDGVSWRATADVGPWGYCYSFGNGSDCVDAVRPQGVSSDQKPLMFGCSPLGSGSPQTTPSMAVAAAANGVHKVVLRFSDGSTASFPVIEVDGQWVYAFAVPGQRVKVVQAREYRANGQLVGTISGGVGWGC